MLYFKTLFAGQRYEKDGATYNVSVREDGSYVEVEDDGDGRVVTRTYDEKGEMETVHTVMYINGMRVEADFIRQSDGTWIGTERDEDGTVWYYYSSAAPTPSEGTLTASLHLASDGTTVLGEGQIDDDGYYHEAAYDLDGRTTYDYYGKVGEYSIEHYYDNSELTETKEIVCKEDRTVTTQTMTEKHPDYDEPTTIELIELKNVEEGAPAFQRSTKVKGQIIRSIYDTNNNLVQFMDEHYDEEEHMSDRFIRSYPGNYDQFTKYRWNGEENIVVSESSTLYDGESEKPFENIVQISDTFYDDEGHLIKKIIDYIAWLTRKDYKWDGEDSQQVREITWDFLNDFDTVEVFGDNPMKFTRMGADYFDRKTYDPITKEEFDYYLSDEFLSTLTEEQQAVMLLLMSNGVAPSEAAEIAIEGNYELTKEEEQPTEEQPTEEQPTEEQPTEEQPVEEQPTEEQPTEEQPVEEQPAEEQPAEEQPTEEQPAEEQPAEEQPAEEQPTEEQPAEEQPAEEQPAEEAA